MSVSAMADKWVDGCLCTYGCVYICMHAIYQAFNLAMDESLINRLITHQLNRLSVCIFIYLLVCLVQPYKSFRHGDSYIWIIVCDP